jgi:hypothetical protein
MNLKSPICSKTKDQTVRSRCFFNSILQPHAFACRVVLDFVCVCVIDDGDVVASLPLLSLFAARLCAEDSDEDEEEVEFEPPEFELKEELRNWRVCLAALVEPRAMVHLKINPIRGVTTAIANMPVPHWQKVYLLMAIC